MHCPRCGQQQISVEIKFCSRCGFPLTLVADILAHGGFLPQLGELYKSKKRITRRNGMIFSLFWMLFFVLIMTPFFGIMDIDELAGMSAIIGIFGGLMIFLGSAFFLKNPFPNLPLGAGAADYPPMGAHLPGAPVYNRNALGAEQSIPAENYVPPAADRWRTPDTNELQQPPSIVENTTKLLQKDD